MSQQPTEASKSSSLEQAVRNKDLQQIQRLVEQGANITARAIEMAVTPAVFMCILNATCNAFAKPAPTQDAFNTLTRIVHCVKQYKLVPLDQLQPYLQLLHNSMDLIRLQTTRFHQLDLANKNPSHFQNCIKEASPKLFDKILLCLLLTRKPEDKVRLYLGACLNTLKDNHRKKLLIIAHILTYFEKQVTQPQQLKAIFVRALAELADIDYAENTTLESLVVYNPKKILFALAKIRLELVKLFTDEYKEIEAAMYCISKIDFLTSYNDIAQSIANVLHQEVDLQNMSLSTFFLDQIEQDCLFYYSHQQNAQVF